MIIISKKEINKSFFFIISSLLPYRSWQVLNSQIFPVFDYTISKYIKQANKSKKHRKSTNIIKTKDIS